MAARSRAPSVNCHSPGGAHDRPIISARRARPRWAKIASLALLAGALFLVWRYTPLADPLTAERIVAWAKSAGAARWLPVLVVFAYTPAAFVIFPRLLITLFAVIAYGPWLGFGTSMIGILGAALATYYAGRAFPSGTLLKVAGEKFYRTSRALRGHGVLAAAAVRIAPIAPSVVIGMVAGAARFRPWQYLAGTALGIVPGTAATVIFADQLMKGLEDPSRIDYWLVAGILIFIIVLIAFVRRWLSSLQP